MTDEQQRSQNIRAKSERHHQGPYLPAQFQHHTWRLPGAIYFFGFFTADFIADVRQDAVNIR